MSLNEWIDEQIECCETCLKSTGDLPGSSEQVKIANYNSRFHTKGYLDALKEVRSRLKFAEESVAYAAAWHAMTGD